MLERLPGFGYRCGLDRRVTTATSGSLEVTGYRSTDLVQGGPRLDDLVHPEDRSHVAQQLADTVDRGRPGHFSYRLCAANGSVHRVWETVWPMREGEGPVEELEGFIATVGAEEETPERGHATPQRLHDPLTGLAERALLEDRLEQVLRRQRRRRSAERTFALLMIDLDGFCEVNQIFGREVGDHLLEVTARRLEACVRQEDTVARLGGNLFAVLLAEIPGATEGLRIAARIGDLLRLPLYLQDEPVGTTASVGMVLGPGEYRYVAELLRDAETAMCRVKVSGGNDQELFAAKPHARAVSRHQLEIDLRRALERRQLSLHYQPIVELPSGRIEGFEALLRWRHPERGLLRPEEFLFSAVETGQIVPITWWVLHRAARQIASWRNARGGRPELYVSVNFSARQFQCDDLIDRVRAALNQEGMAPQSLRIELKESALMGGDAVARALRSLRSEGVRLALDDFGTGYSSLGALSRLPIHSLKVDRSFVQAVGEEKPRAIDTVRTIVNMAKGLTMQVVGEGVEQQHQAERLGELGCGFAQGYFFARPVAAKGIDAMLTASEGAPAAE